MFEMYPRELREARIFVAGHKGLVGSALMRAFSKYGFNNTITKTSLELNLEVQAEVDEFFKDKKPAVVFLAAARVGGILANKDYPADFLLKNLQIQTNVISSALKHGTTKLVYFGSSCIYPKVCPQPIKEKYLLTNSLESTNEPYAIAKIAGVKLCEAIFKQHKRSFVSLMPCNLYGPGDNYDLKRSHVIPGLVRRIHEGRVAGANKIALWGSGAPLREFLHSDDLADASLMCLRSYYDDQPINIGSSSEISIRNLASMIAEIVGYHGEITWDRSMPDGTPRKILDVSKITLMGWKPKISLYDGIASVYKDFLENHA